MKSSEFVHDLSISAKIQRLNQKLRLLIGKNQQYYTVQNMHNVDYT